MVSPLYPLNIYNSHCADPNSSCQHLYSFVEGTSVTVELEWLQSMPDGNWGINPLAWDNSEMRGLYHPPRLPCRIPALLSHHGNLHENNVSFWGHLPKKSKLCLLLDDSNPHLNLPAKTKIRQWLNYSLPHSILRLDWWWTGQTWSSPSAYNL